jgi:uncharacterized MAPEG superfamily protein
MPVPLSCLLGFVVWTLLLVVCIGGTRVTLVLRGKARANAFPADTPHGGEMYRRLLRAHLNCLENLPLFGAVVLTAQVQGVSGATLDGLARVYLAARVSQSCIHISSGRSRAVNLRFLAFVTQLVCLVGMLGVICR